MWKNLDCDVVIFHSIGVKYIFTISQNRKQKDLYCDVVINASSTSLHSVSTNASTMFSKHCLHSVSDQNINQCIFSIFSTSAFEARMLNVSTVCKPV